MIALPQYIDREAWQGFEDMRALAKKPMTDRARKLIVSELQKIKDAGHCPNAALDQSTNHCWADVYVPQDKPIKAAATSDADRTARYLAEERQRDAALQATRSQRQPIRRVA
jgi:transglutaminase-like putative cysteine protease